MKNIENVIEKYEQSKDIQIDELPNLDLYMDQVLTFFSNSLAEKPENKKSEVLTKSMVNNYTKEKILSPIKGKKYTKSQIVQLLCIMNLKQTLSLHEIRVLLNAENMNEEQIQQAYTASLALKNKLVPLVSKNLVNTFSHENKEENKLAIVLALSSLSNFLNNIASDIVNDLEIDE